MAPVVSIATVLAYRQAARLKRDTAAECPFDDEHTRKRLLLEGALLDDTADQLEGLKAQARELMAALELTEGPADAG